LNTGNGGEKKRRHWSGWKSDRAARIGKEVHNGKIFGGGRGGGLDLAQTKERGKFALRVGWDEKDGRNKKKETK